MAKPFSGWSLSGVGLRAPAVVAGLVLTVGLLLRLNPVLVVATTLAGASAAIAFIRPRWGILLFFGWLAIADLLKRLIFLGTSISTPPSELEYAWILLLPDVVLLSFVVRGALTVVRTRKLPFRPSTLDLAVAAYLGLSMISLLNPTFPIEVRLAGFKSSSIYIFLYFVVRWFGVEDRIWLRRLKTTVLWAALLAGAYGLVQATFGFQGFELRWLASGLTELAGPEEGLGLTINLFGIVRPFSVFASHEQLGWFLAFALLLMLWPVPSSRWDWAAIAFLAFSIARTLSRSSWAFLILGLACVSGLALLTRTRRLLKPALVTGAVFVASILIWPLLLEQGQAFRQRAGMVGSYEWRVFSVRQLIQDPEWRRPLGNGIGSMWVAWRMDAPGTANPDERILSHLGAIDTIYELGWVGFLTFAGMLGLAAAQGLHWLRTRPFGEVPNLLTIALGVVLGVAGANTAATTVLMFRPIAAPFWLMLGVVGAALASANPTPGGDAWISGGNPSSGSLPA
jgi:hypothetical protein